MFPHARVTAFAARARIERLRGRPADALAFADHGLAVTTGRGVLPSHVSTLHMVRAEALHAPGRTDESRAPLRCARDHIATIAATLDDPELRESFVTNIAAHHRTLALAREWLDESPG